MNKLENGVIRYQIDFEKYKNGQANEVIALLDNACKELSKFIKKTDGVYTKKRYLEIARKLRDVSKALKENVGNGIDIDGIIDYELKKQKKLLESVKGDIVKAKGGTVNFLYPTREQIKTAALFKPVTENFTYESYLDGIEAGLYNIWDSAVRTGYLTGQTTQQIVRNVMGGVSQQTRLANPGLIQTLRNSVYGNTRTVLQSFAEETKERVYEKNEQYFGDGETEYKYERIAALDSRTCLVCANLDGKLYKTLKEAQPVILHRGDRCVLLPYFNIEGDTRASKDGYVSSKVTYSEWLGEQDEKTQKEVLGKTRFEMYKNGTKISQFVDNGKVLTLKELYEKSGINYGFFNKGKPMTYEEATNAINPTGDAYNCQTCVVAYEARLCGYRDVYALKREGNEYCNMLADNPMLAWLDEKGEHPKPHYLNIKDNNVKSLYDEINKNVKNTERHMFGFTFIGDDGKYHGHVISAYKENERLVLYDPQRNVYNDEGILYAALFGKEVREKYRPFLLKLNGLKFDEPFVENILGEQKNER